MSEKLLTQKQVHESLQKVFFKLTQKRPQFKIEVMTLGACIEILLDAELGISEKSQIKRDKNGRFAKKGAK